MERCGDCEHRAVSAADWTNEVTNLLLFLILIVLIAQLFDSHRRGADFSKEDETVKLATEEVKTAKKNVDKAKQRIPSDKTTN